MLFERPHWDKPEPSRRLYSSRNILSYQFVEHFWLRATFSFYVFACSSSRGFGKGIGSSDAFKGLSVSRTRSTSNANRTMNCLCEVPYIEGQKS